MHPSEEIVLGESGMTLKDGILIDKNGKPIKKKICPKCEMPAGFCDCPEEFEG